MTDQFGFVNVSTRVMESEYFEATWKSRIQTVKKRLGVLVRHLTKRYRKKTGYTRFLTDEEQRFNNNYYCSLALDGKFIEVH